MVARLQPGPLLHAQNCTGCETKTNGTGAALNTTAHCAPPCAALACDHTGGVHILPLSCTVLLLLILCLTSLHPPGTRDTTVSLRCRDKVEPQPVETFGGLLPYYTRTLHSVHHSLDITRAHHFPAPSTTPRPPHGASCRGGKFRAVV